jgi:3-mercaptopropionate dioxygenase
LRPLGALFDCQLCVGPGAAHPVHDHTVWGLIGMLRGVEISRNYAADPSGKLVSQAVLHLTPGQIMAVSRRIGDIHQVENALTDRASISIHAYGANIGALARHVYLLESGETKPFVSGYANDRLPNLWDRSAETRARLSI